MVNFDFLIAIDLQVYTIRYYTIRYSTKLVGRQLTANHCVIE